jgi:hypothetical protein
VTTYDLCSRCHRLKSVRKNYADLLEPGYRIQGPCDRCGCQGLDLWPMVEKDVLTKLAEIPR